MAINKVLVGEALVNDNDPSGTMAEIAHIDLLIGPRGSAAETAFCNGLVNNKDGFTSLLAVVAPNLPCKPNTMMFNKVTIKGAKQAVQMFGPAQKAVAMAVADSVEAGVIPKNEAADLYICVGVFIHWEANSDEAIYENNYKKKLIKSEKISNTTTKHHIDLYPKKSEEFIKINLTIIDSKSMRLEKITMQDKNGGTYTYIIENFDSNTNTEQFNFQVKDYKGIEVIDLR